MGTTPPDEEWETTGLELYDVCDKLSLESTSVHSLRFGSDSESETDSTKFRLKAQEKHDCIDGRVEFQYERHQSVPTVVYSYECLKELVIDYNDIKEIPDEFCQRLTQLKTLSIMGNKLCSLPSNIHLLQHLEQLFVDENVLSELPNQLCQLSELKRLHSQGNRIKELPQEFNCLTQLKYLKLNENHLNCLPEMFGFLTQLEELDLSYNSISCLPKTFGSLESIRILNISHNILKSLPESFGHLSQLVILELSSNGLYFLPETLCSAKSLKKLFVDNNEIVLIPDWFGDMECIEELCMKSNYLRDNQFPQRFGNVCQKLIKFDISGNLVNQLPESFSLIKTLEFVDTGSALFEPERKRNMRNGNNIKRLPNNFGMDYSVMKELRLDENDIEELPNCFGDGMSNLELLDLYCNAIEYLPDSICKLKSLKFFSIGMNCLKKLPKNFGDLSALEEFRAEINELKSLPQTFDKLVKLRVLDLYKNSFDAFPTILKNLENIKSLQIGLQVSEMAIKINGSQQFKIERLKRALSSGVMNRTKRTNFFINFYNSSDNQNSSQESTQTESMSSSFYSSGYSSLHASHDKVDSNNENSTIGLEQSWDLDEFDPQRPYLCEPLTYPNSHRIQTPVEELKNFIPLKLHVPKIDRTIINKRRRLSPVEGQFDSPEKS